MKIIVVGDGKVGYTLAEKLSEENHDVVIVDKNANALSRAGENLDVLCINGNGAVPDVLIKAGAASADVLIAATSADEINMLCCISAKKFGTRYTVARIREPEYFYDIGVLRRHFSFDVVINPERSTAAEILRLLRFPNADEISVFVRGKVEVVGFRALASDSIIGVPLSKWRKRLPVSVLVCIVERKGEVILPRGDFAIDPDDKVYIAGISADVTRFFRTIGRTANIVKDVMIVGGGRIAHYLAEDALQNGIRPKIIENNWDVCRNLAAALPGATIIRSDGTDQSVLDSEHIADAASFVALTGSDEENLMISLYAVQCGVRKVVAKSNRFNYRQVVQSLGLESVLSPKEITANLILNFIRGLHNADGSSVEALYRLIDGQAEALELEINSETRHLKEKIKTLPLRKNMQIAIIARRGSAVIPTGDDFIEEGDNIVIITTIKGCNDLNDFFDD